MKDFLQAVALRLKGLFVDRPVYWGRLPQGERRPCFYLLPARARRRELPCGRVWRELGLELRFYDAGAAGAASQERVGERLLRELGFVPAADFGRSVGRRGYRGRGLNYRQGAEYLLFEGRYEYYTTLEQEMLEAAEPLALGGLMEEIGFGGGLASGGFGGAAVGEIELAADK